LFFIVTGGLWTLFCFIFIFFILLFFLFLNFSILHPYFITWRPCTPFSTATSAWMHQEVCLFLCLVYSTWSGVAIWSISFLFLKWEEVFSVRKRIYLVWYAKFSTFSKILNSVLMVNGKKEIRYPRPTTARAF
jgi:hypothetical protein